VPVSWPDQVDDVLAGDLTVALGCVTPAGGATVTAVAPIGLRDRASGTVGFTTSLGFNKKLDRMRRDPRVALAYHAREHGHSSQPTYVLVQGRAEPEERPSEASRELIERSAPRFLGPPRKGRFWDAWLREYYAVRILVRVTVERIVVWPDHRCEGSPEVIGEPLPVEPPQPQAAPRKGTAPRISVGKAYRRLERLPHVLLAWVQADGYPAVVPVALQGVGNDGFELSAAPGLIPAGSRRAGLLGHSYRAQAIGLTSRLHTGWLDTRDGRAVYAPHSEQGFVAPPNKTLLLLANGLLAKRGVKKAKQEGKIPAGVA
jgi:hypothetical protein